MKIGVKVKTEQGTVKIFKAEAHGYGIGTALKSSIAVTAIIVAVKGKYFGIHINHLFEIYYGIGVNMIKTVISKENKNPSALTDGFGINIRISDRCAQEGRVSSVRG